jgi:hypothetical protein
MKGNFIFKNSYIDQSRCRRLVRSLGLHLAEYIVVGLVPQSWIILDLSLYFFILLEFIILSKSRAHTINIVNTMTIARQCSKAFFIPYRHPT